MAKLRVLLDEDVRIDVKSAFAKKIQVHTVPSLGISGADDMFVIEEAVTKKCLIVTANKDFVPANRNHEWRKGAATEDIFGVLISSNTARP